MNDMTQTLPLNDDGTLQAWAWPGGYPLFYVDGDNSVLCPDCATQALHDENKRLRPCAVDVNYEDMALYCEECSEQIEPPYPTESGFDADEEE
jgi:hypothetical protein